MKLRDALFLVHPKDKDAQRQAIFDKIVNRQLEVPYTWEVELSALGQQHFESDEDRKKAFALKWQELIESGKMGYMALMRNLSNILFFWGGCGVSASAVQQVIDRLSDARQVARSKQLPFGYLPAYREVEKVAPAHAVTVMNALEAAVIGIADGLLPLFKFYRTAIV